MSTGNAPPFPDLWELTDSNTAADLWKLQAIQNSARSPEAQLHLHTDVERAAGDFQQEWEKFLEKVKDPSIYGLHIKAIALLGYIWGSTAALRSIGK